MLSDGKPGEEKKIRVCSLKKEPFGPSSFTCDEIQEKTNDRTPELKVFFRVLPFATKSAQRQILNCRGGKVRELEGGEERLKLLERQWELRTYLERSKGKMRERSSSPTPGRDSKLLKNFKQNRADGKVIVDPNWAEQSIRSA